MTDALPDFDLITDALRQVESDSDAAECHGSLCGLMCTVDELDIDYWLSVTLPESEAIDLQAKDTLALLSELFTSTQQQFESESFDFHLLLPFDEVGLEARIEALGHWCQGFLLGLSMGGVTETTALPGDLPELVQDLVDIARAESYELMGDEEDEGAYAELVEFVRMGVLLFREEMRGQAETMMDEEKPYLH